MKTIYLSLAFLLLFLMSCDIKEKRVKTKGAVYIKPTVDRRGRFRKGHIRMPVSTNKNAIKNQNRSRYYYKTRGKYRNKK
jgi:hypothetical protein